jgi:asparagine synthase (glutamine-hydrolysing)
MALAGTGPSLRYRAPYLHYGLAEFAASVPARVHAEGHGEALLRLILADLPSGREPSGPGDADGLPLAAWLRGPLAPALRDCLQRGAIADEGWFDCDATATLVAEHLGGERDHSPELWPLLVLGLWLDRLRGGDD